jgi:hypothetical protein
MAVNPTLPVTGTETTFDPWLFGSTGALALATAPETTPAAATLPADDLPPPASADGTLLASRGQSRVAALRTEIENAYDMNGNDLAAKVHALSVTERNELLRTLSPSGVEQLTLELAQARTGNPRAYAQLRADLLNGQPPAEIARLINAALRWDQPNNPSGQMLGQPLVADLASYIAENGTKGQKLGLIDLLTDARQGGWATRNNAAAGAVGELFRGLNYDPKAINQALAMMSQSDKAAVARSALRADSPAEIDQLLKFNALATSAPQRAQMLEQFMLALDGSGISGERRQAALEGITATLLRSPDSTFSALRREDQQGADALATYLGYLAQSRNAGDIKGLFAALKYGADLGGQRSAAELEAIDRARFNAPDMENATNRGYLVGALQQALDRFGADEAGRNKLSRNIVTGGIFTAGAIGAKLLGPWGVLASLGATGLSFINSQFNNPATLQTANEFNREILSLARPVVAGTNGRPQEVRDPGNVRAFLDGVDQARLTQP